MSKVLSAHSGQVLPIYLALQLLANVTVATDDEGTITDLTISARESCDVSKDMWTIAFDNWVAAVRRMRMCKDGKLSRIPLWGPSLEPMRQTVP